MKRKPIIVSAFLALIAMIVMPFVINAEDSAQLELVNKNVKDLYSAGDEFTVDVNLSNAKTGAEQIGFAVVFDDQKLELEDADEENAKMVAWPGNTPGGLSGNVTVLDYRGAGKTLNDKTLTSLRFKVKTGATGSTEIKFNNVDLSNVYTTEAEKVSLTASTNSLTINFATPLQSISLDTAKENIGVDETTTINVNYNPSNTTDSKNVTWKSSNTSVATVDASGKVTGVSTGTTTITATSAVTGVSPATIDIHVVSELQSISLNKSSADITKGKDETLTVTYNPTNTTSNKAITWSSSNTNVATVDENGKVTAVNYGTATITATSAVTGIAPATCEVTVSNHLKSISLSESEFNLNRGNNKTLTVSYTAENANEDTTAFARYMSNAMFLIPTPQLLQKVITGLDDLYEHDIAELDMQGDLYEYMLGKLATAGQNGQFRTPKHIREMMVELLQPSPDDTICDPACELQVFWFLHLSTFGVIMKMT